MDYQVVILSDDEIFARMLELEFSFRQLRVLATAKMKESDGAEVLILDLDSAIEPPVGQYRTMIGFSRRPAFSAEDARSCSMILRRPFRMDSLRREVLTHLGESIPAEALRVEEVRRHPAAREILLREADRIMLCDRQTVALSPQEFRILECLLKHRARSVSRAVLADVIGQSGTNKVDVYICYLRRKTDNLPGGRLIETVRGEGYRIE